jgi:hypothetical protein
VEFGKARKERDLSCLFTRLPSPQRGHHGTCSISAKAIQWRPSPDKGWEARGFRVTPEPSAPYVASRPFSFGLDHACDSPQLVRNMRTICFIPSSTSCFQPHTQESRHVSHYHCQVSEKTRLSGFLPNTSETRPVQQAHQTPTLKVFSHMRFGCKVDFSASLCCPLPSQPNMIAHRMLLVTGQRPPWPA